VIGQQFLELLAAVLASRFEWCSSASGLPRRQIAIVSASATSLSAMVVLTDQPTTRHENRSMTAVT